MQIGRHGYGVITDLPPARQGMLLIRVEFIIELFKMYIVYL